MRKTFLLLTLVPFLFAFLSEEEPAPYTPEEPLPILHWSAWIETIDDPALHIVFLDRYGQLEDRCAENVETWEELHALTIDLHDRVNRLGGVGQTIARVGTTHLQHLDPFDSSTQDLTHAVAELEARLDLEQGHRTRAARHFGWAHDKRWHHPYWCQDDIQTLRWLQYRHRVLSHAVLRVIDSLSKASLVLGSPDKTEFYLELISPR